MAKVKVYDMEMEFELQVGLKSINNFMNNMGFEGKTSVGGQILTIKQTLLFVPDNDYIKNIQNTVIKHFAESNSDLDVVDCTFRGYKKFLEREVEVEDENKE